MDFLGTQAGCRTNPKKMFLARGDDCVHASHYNLNLEIIGCQEYVKAGKGTRRAARQGVLRHNGVHTCSVIDHDVVIGHDVVIDCVRGRGPVLRGRAWDTVYDLP